MNTIPASSVGNSRIATGTIAMAGIGRANSVSGPNTSENAADRPSRMPVTTPTSAASPKPVRILISDCPRSSQYSSVPRRFTKDVAISVTVGNVSNRNQARTWLAVSSCHSAIAAITDATRTSRRRHNGTARDRRESDRVVTGESMTPATTPASVVVIPHPPVPAGNPPERCLGERRCSAGRLRVSRTAGSSSRHSPRPTCRRTIGCPVRYQGRRRPGPSFPLRWRHEPP